MLVRFQSICVMAMVCSPSELAEQIGMTVEYVSGIENFCEPVNQPCFFGIARMLECENDGCRLVGVS